MSPLWKFQFRTHPLGYFVELLHIVFYHPICEVV